jgi:hypothetical protein
MDRFDKLGPILESFTRESPIEIYFAKKNTDMAVRHNLNKIPTRIIIGVPSIESTFFKGNRTWTKKTIYLQSSVNAVKVTVHVM